MVASIISSHDQAIAAGVDGYIDAETGLFVFTSEYHLARGFCCGNGCRHCPFSGGAD